MPQFITGKTKCPICEQVIQNNQGMVGFSPFIGNELDPLYFFNDAVCHEECFRAHPLSDQAWRIYEQVLENAKPENRIDVVTGEVIDNPGDYLTFGYLTDDETDPLYRFNYLHIRPSTLRSWANLADFITAMEDAQNRGEWQAPGLDPLLELMRENL